ncbi:Acid protease [Yarrowia sp. B02]|nr:Acid protease [Yarrowia sp. B02]
MLHSFATLAALLALANAAPAHSGTLKLDFTKRVGEPGHPSRHSPSLGKDTPKAILKNHLVFYDTEITLGTPLKTFTVDLDTGSSDLWVAADGRNGSYNPNNSSSYQEYKPGFSIGYVDGSHAEGNWVKDTIGFGGATISEFIFAAADKVASTQQVFGIGYPALEASSTNPHGDPFTYDNFPIRLAKDGIINTPSYSLYLNNLDADSGSVLFGGVDTSKFSGELTILQTLPEPYSQTTAEFLVTLDSIDVSVDNKSTNVLDKTRHVLLDSGTTLTYLPTETYQTLVSTLGLVDSVDYGAGTTKKHVDELIAKNVVITYTLQGQTIAVPAAQLFYLITDRYGNKVYFDQDGQTEEFYGFLCADGSDGDKNNAPETISYIFGDSFLRSAYVVYDIANDIIALGQADYDKTEGSIVPIQTGSEGIPSATSASVTATWTRNEPITTSAPEVSTVVPYTNSGVPQTTTMW